MKQRREKDGRLVSIFKDLKTECEKYNLIETQQETSSKEGRDGKEGDMEDPWLEELKLTEAEKPSLWS